MPSYGYDVSSPLFSRLDATPLAQRGLGIDKTVMRSKRLSVRWTRAICA